MIRFFLILLTIISTSLPAQTKSKSHSKKHDSSIYYNQENKLKPSDPERTKGFQRQKVAGVKYNNHTFRQLSFALVGMIAGSIIGQKIAKSIEAKMFKTEDESSIANIIGIATGSTLGLSSGIYLGGNDYEQQGSFTSTLIGTTVGTGLSIVIYSGISQTNKSGEINDIVIALLVAIPPVVSGFIGFHSSKKYRSMFGRSLVNINNKNISLGVPTYYVQKSTYDRNRSIDMFSVINMKF